MTTNFQTKNEAVIYLDQIQPDDSLVRRWGFECEHPLIARAKESAYYANVAPYDFKTDASVESLNEDGCECGCSECSEHDCNCDNCEMDDYPDHCQGSECEAPNEIALETPTRFAFPEDAKAFLQTCKNEIQVDGDADFRAYGKKWSGHIHVEARDLTRVQLRNAVAIGEKMRQLAPEWLTEWADDYNMDGRATTAEWFHKGSTARLRRDSFISIWNCANNDVRPFEIGQEWDGRKSTVEFRFWRVTFDYELLKIRGAVSRAVIAYSLNESSTYWILNCKTFEEFARMIGVGKH
jgi:hypothetical protein